MLESEPKLNKSLLCSNIEIYMFDGKIVNIHQEYDSYDNYFDKFEKHMTYLIKQYIQLSKNFHFNIPSDFKVLHLLQCYRNPL